MPIKIKPSTIVKTVLFGLIPIVMLIAYAITGYKYIPVEYSLGKCMKDFGNTLAYQERSSELKDAYLNVDDAHILICYGSPNTEYNEVYGKQVPYDELWQFGENEPTRLYTDKDLVIGEVVVPKGRYSLYAVPGKWKWEIFISESIDHWGNNINEKVRSREIGSFEVRPQYNPTFVEELTFRESDNQLIAEWGKTVIRIPLENIDDQDVKHITILSRFWALL